MDKTVCLSLCGIAFVALSGAGCATEPAITQAELFRRTQELVDAVAPGDRTPWKRYYADDCMVFDEKGKNKSKSALVEEITPLPKGVSGNIQVANAQSRIEGNVAILELAVLRGDG